MDEATIKKYLAEDYARALAYYDKSAERSKRAFRVMSVYLILVSAGLTLGVTLGPNTDSWRWVGGVLSASISITTALLAHFKFQENWLSFRRSWDALEHERRLFAMAAGVYKDVPDRATLFVERVEAVLSKEASEFYPRHAKGQEPEKEPEQEPRTKAP